MTTHEQHKDALSSYIPLGTLARLIPPIKGDKSPNPATVHRWGGRGCFGVKLRTVFVGGVRCSTREWLEEFFAAVAAARDGQPEQPARVAAPDRTPTRRSRENARAARELETLGIG